MKLPKVVKEGKKVRMTLSISESDLAMLKDYAKFYKIVYEEEIKENELIVHIIKNYMETDKDFISHLGKMMNMPIGSKKVAK